MLTLIDSLDSLLLFQEYDLFFDALKKLREVTFHRNLDVSVFEVNIRILGGLLSAHQLACKLFNTVNNDERENDGRILGKNEIFISDDNDDSKSENIDNNIIRNYNCNEILRNRDVNDDNNIFRNRNINDDNIDRNSNNDENNLSRNRNHIDNRIRNRKIFYNSNHERCVDYEDIENKCLFSNNNENRNRYEYDGIFLLNLAIDIADRLMPAFQTMTGVPVHKINLMYGLDGFSNIVNDNSSSNSNNDKYDNHINNNNNNNNDDNNNYYDHNNSNNNSSNNNNNNNNNNSSNNNKIGRAHV